MRNEIDETEIIKLSKQLLLPVFNPSVPSRDIVVITSAFYQFLKESSRTMFYGFLFPLFVFVNFFVTDDNSCVTRIM